MKRVTVSISVGITLLVFAGVHFTWLYRADSGNEASRRLSIKVMPGATFKEVQYELVDKGIITRPNVFRWAAWLTRRETKIKSGKYLFRQGQSVASVLDKLVSGEIDHFRVVIPEGLMITEIASILQHEAEVDSSLMVAAAGDSSLLAELGIRAPSLEGYLFPDTYMFEWPLSERSALKRMVHRFRRVYDQAVGTLPDSISLSQNEIVTLASIVQAEAVFESEMPKISAVYHNRLDADWRLEADPTVAYALGGVKRKLWYKDLRVDSPYNTYRVRGLPPGAICNPGEAALKAAAHPEQGNLDFYFVADGTGYHKFSRTYFEHLRAKHQIKYGTVPEQMKQKSYLEASGEDDEIAGGKASGEASGTEGKQSNDDEGNREDDSDRP